MFRYFFFIFQNSRFLHSAFCTFGTPPSALRIPHSRFPLTVLFTYSVSVDSIKYPLLMCRFEEKTGVRTTECGMRSEWCITRDLCLEWGISFLLEISAYIKINVKKDQDKDVSTVRRSFSRWEVKKLACFLLGATWKWPSNGRNVVIPFLTLIFIFWNPFRKICRDLRLAQVVTQGGNYRLPYLQSCVVSKPWYMFWF